MKTNSVSGERKGILAVEILICILILASATVIYTKKREENKSTIRVAAILGSEKISFWEEVRKGLRQAAKEQGILLTEYTPEDEANFPDLIESAYYMDVNAIAICIYESDMWEECEPILKKIREKGIKVIVTDTPPKTEDYDAYIGLDNYAVGQKMAENIYENYTEGQSILIRKPASQENLVLERRREGFYDKLEEYGLKDQIVYIPDTNDEIERIKEVKEYLQQVKNSAVVATFTTNTTTEMAEIIYSGEYQNNIRLIGFGEITDKVKNYIDEGIIDMFLAQDNQNIGYKIIYAVNSLCQGKESHEKNWNVDLMSYDESKEN